MSKLKMAILAIDGNYSMAVMEAEPRPLRTTVGLRETRLTFLDTFQSKLKSREKGHFGVFRMLRTEFQLCASGQVEFPNLTFENR